MKSKKRQTPSSPPGPRQETHQREPDRPIGATKSIRRLWAFRLSACVLVPLLLLGLLEAGLRLAGYGYPAGFFLKDRIGGRAAYTDNQKFGYRFFPRALVRTPEPQVFPVEKTNDTFRVFVFGESAAMGDPEPAYGLPRMLEVLLRERYPRARFEVVNAAMTAINSHAILPIARDAAPLHGDIWVIYMGNNEVYGPFGAGTVFGPQTPDLSVIRANLALKKFRLGQCLDAWKAKLGGASQTPSKWSGMGMFLDQQLRPADPRREKVHGHFRKNLEDILRAGRQAGVKMIVCTVASNLKDSAPFASLHAPGLTPAMKEQWEKLYDAGVAAESLRNYQQAIEQFVQASPMDDQFAELKFRMGRCYLALGRIEEARRNFAAARDLDALPFRADSELNRIVEQTAGGRARDGIYVLDGEQALLKKSAAAACGEEFFHEHVHLNFDGNYALAMSVAEQISSLLPTSLTAGAGARADFPSAAECAERLAYTDWDRYQIAKKLARRMQEAPFNTQLDHELRDERLRQELAELEPRTRRAALDSALEQYRRALAPNDGDWMLHDHFAQLLVAAGNATEAERQWQRVIELVPQNFVARYQLGSLLLGLGRGVDARACFQAALQLRSDSAEAVNGLGLAYARTGENREAMQEFERAIQLNPEFADAYVNWGLLLARRGMMEEARHKFEEAVRVRPDSALAQVNLGLSLAGQKKFKEAVPHYASAADLNPNDPSTQFYWGNALVALGQTAPAMEHYAQALMLNPNHAEAHLNLGVECARKNQSEEAQRHFSEAIRINPDYAEAHLNLGLIMMKQGRMAEAVQHFDQTLRLDPNNGQAKKLVQLLTREKKSPPGH